MKVVIDPNISVSSFFGGNPRKIIDLCEKRDISLRLSKDIFEEHVDVLQKVGLKEEREFEELLSPLVMELLKLSFLRLSLDLWFKELNICLVDYRKKPSQNRPQTPPTKCEEESTRENDDFHKKGILQALQGLANGSKECENILHRRSILRKEIVGA